MRVFLNVAQVAANMRVLGYGPNRAGVWVQGCKIGCPGCSSLHTHDAASGRVVPVEKMIDWFGAQTRPVTGLTISGGEPTEQEKPVSALIQAFRDAFAQADVLMFSGLPWRYLVNRHEELVKACDIVIAGPYVGSLPPLPLRGSSNQTVHLLTPLAVERYHDLDQWPVYASQTLFASDRLITVGIPDTAALGKSILGNRVFDSNTVSWIQPKRGEVE